ncbi:AAA domain protein [Leptospira interrogans serovar Valbuzzi str. Duyster]|uniref:ATP-dependent nuclease n=1 Tax=Leptospira interrogans TaxID=173 RepID=UPI0002BA26D9|nr:AAA family ATPase [Leptospira interrogans]EMJ57507.1 AAA domain protein [Leptospira interrogans serovar Valbuzzi str. Duyster]ENO74229.1 AAA domain protein [Leptospira interrogans serovar Valbuzzi str. Valbuzzi]
MQLSKIKLINFRSINFIEIDLYEFNSCIGPNNSGKSSVLNAIYIFLNQEKISGDDFRNGINDDLIISGEFTNIENWERVTPGIAGIVYNNKIELRLIAKLVEVGDGELSIEQEYQAYVSAESITGFNNKWSELSSEIQSIAISLGLNGTSWKSAANKEIVKQKIRETLPNLITAGDAMWSSDNISIKEALKQALPVGILIPAVSDAIEETKPKQNSSLNILLNMLVFPEIKASPEYKSFIDSLNNLTSKLGGEEDQQLSSVLNLGKEISKRISDIVPSSIRFGIEEPDTEKILSSNAFLRINDGTETKISYQGHGIQRALVFSLIEVLSNRRSIAIRGDIVHQRSAILLFEEPELYLHPHLIRRLKKSLQDITKNGKWQVVISTHSPFLVEVADNPRSLILFRKNNQNSPPIITQSKLDPFEINDSTREDRNALRAALDFHPTVTESFFAKRVVLVEGDTEVAILRHSHDIFKEFNISEERVQGTTIVSCGGKWTIPAIARILVVLNVPFRIIHDKDAKNISENELISLSPIHPYNANSRIKDSANGNPIFIVEDTFEDVINLTQSGSDKPYRAWDQVRNAIQEGDLMNRFPKLHEIFKFAFEW